MGALARAVKRAPKDTARILTIDIERLPGEAYAFDARTEYIRPSQWIRAPRTVCWAARWYGEKTPIFEAEWIDPDAMVHRAWELYDEADAVITYNGIRFDNKHLKGMWLTSGLKLPRPWKDIDLIRPARQFGFVSASLDYVTKTLGRPGKVDKYDAEVARAACAGDERAQRKLRRYNVGDIELTEWLYDRFRGWIPNHPYLGAPAGDGKTCNQCGSDKLTAMPTRYRAVVIDYMLLRCDRCGGHVRAGWHARAANTRGVG